MENSPGSGDELLLSAALDVGEQLLVCGGEVGRVEDTIRRICVSYGAERTDVFAITSSIVVTMHRAGRAVTQTRRISRQQTDFLRLEALNALSRDVCAHTPPVETLGGRVRETVSSGRDILPLDILGYMLASGAFAVFFGGGGRDALGAALGGLLILFLERKGKPLCHSQLIYFLLCSLISGLFAAGCTALGLCPHMDKVMIGDIMLLIPGVPMTNAIRDLMTGDTISGMLRLLEALIQAAAIACGFALALWLTGGWIH